MDLVELLKRPEGKTLEFKRDLSTPEGALRTIVAFANTAGGTLVLGVEDKSRHVRGVRDPLDLEERLANLISDLVAPRLVPEIEILPWRRTQVLAVQVHPSPSRPHYLKRKGREGGVFVRVGSTNRHADRELIEELGRFARGEVFDERPMPELDSEALDFRAASESFAPVRKLTRADLETLRLLTGYQGRKVPTVGGMLLFGRDRERRFPDAWIQAGRFQGADRSRIVDRAEIHSFPARAIEEAIAFVHKHALHGAEIGAVHRRERWSLPPLAVREAVKFEKSSADPGRMDAGRKERGSGPSLAPGARCAAGAGSILQVLRPSDRTARAVNKSGWLSGGGLVKYRNGKGGGFHGRCHDRPPRGASGVARIGGRG